MSIAKTVWLITGASRGIGLELTRQAAAQPSTTIFAAVRNPQGADKLREVKGDIQIITLDSSNEESIKSAAGEVEKRLGGRGIDYLVNNAAITAGYDKAFSMSSSDLTASFTTNVLGPALIGTFFVHLIEKSEKKTLVNMTSGLSSFAHNFGPVNASYSITKTALNMLTYKQAKERKDLVVVCVDPGWVLTDMGGPNAMLKVEHSVENILKTVTSLDASNSGKFYNYKGEEQPW